VRLSLEALLVLDAVDRKGSFAAAAEELHRVPSAITYAVQKLEQDLDIMLFDRSGHKAQFTPAGKLLLEDGRHLLRAAQETERRVQHLATGWEAEINIAVDDLVPLENVLTVVDTFYRTTQATTQVRVLTEVFGGTWDALVTGRAELAVGASGEEPAGAGFATQPIGQVEFVFAVAPDHPLAQEKEPLNSDQILRYRAIAAADSSRQLTPRTSALLSGQEVLTLPNMHAKVEAHRRGLGVGTVPRYMVADDLKLGRLVEKRTESGALVAQLALAWRSRRPGKALAWFIDTLKTATLLPPG
jgi:DNA-binding transcriptional LysR family regulator